MTTEVSSGRRGARSGALSVVATCLAITTLDGLDLIMYGAVLPSLLEAKQWGMTAASAGFIGSLSLIGMLIGATVCGYVTDIVGRRPVILGCVVVFSAFTALCAFATSYELFGAFRFLAGLGFGGALPTVIALTMEYVRQDRRQFYNGVVQTGFTIGGCIVAIAAMFVIPTLGWHAMFLVGGALGIVVLAIAVKSLPESIEFLERTGRTEKAMAMRDRYGLDTRTPASAPAPDAVVVDRNHALKVMTSPRYRAATVLFPVICFCGLLVAYAMNTWIPQMLRASGYDLGSPLSFLLAFNLGSGIGMVVLSGLADRIGSRPVIAAGFLTGAAAVSLLTLAPAQAIVFTLVLLIGFCSASQTAVSGFVGVYYPSTARGTALGLSLGLGRLGGVCGPIIAGIIVGSSLGTDWAYYLFAVIGVLAAVLVVLVPRRGERDEPTTSTAPAHSHDRVSVTQRG